MKANFFWKVVRICLALRCIQTNHLTKLIDASKSKLTAILWLQKFALEDFLSRWLKFAKNKKFQLERKCLKDYIRFDATSLACSTKNSVVLPPSFFNFIHWIQPSFFESLQISPSIGKQPYLSRNLLHNSKNRRHNTIKFRIKSNFNSMTKYSRQSRRSKAQIWVISSEVTFVW